MVVLVVWPVEHEGYHIAWPNLVIAFHCTVVHMHKASIGGLLYAVSTAVLQPFGH